MDRRGFLKGAFAAALFMGAVEWPGKSYADTGGPLSMYNTHTDEYLSIAYRDEKGYIPESMDKIDNFLRCHYNGAVHKIEPGLIDLLSKVDGLYGGGNLIHVISGYRSPEYNAILVKNSGGVASHSLHTKGMAIDFRIPDVGMKDLYGKVRTLMAGGAGIYEEFVHMDVGRVRFWGQGAA